MPLFSSQGTCSRRWKILSEKTHGHPRSGFKASLVSGSFCGIFLFHVWWKRQQKAQCCLEPMRLSQMQEISGLYLIWWSLALAASIAGYRLWAFSSSTLRHDARKVNYDATPSCQCGSKSQKLIRTFDLFVYMWREIGASSATTSTPRPCKEPPHMCSWQLTLPQPTIFTGQIKSKRITGGEIQLVQEWEPWGSSCRCFCTWCVETHTWLDVFGSRVKAWIDS